MIEILKLAGRNLLRYRRRTGLTSALIVIGVFAVLLFISVTGSFKRMMIGQITDSFLGQLQVHRRGYVASLESLPLNLNMPEQLAERVREALERSASVEAYAPRIKFGAMFSNFSETTSVRVNGIDPQREAAVVPLLSARQLNGERRGTLLEPGEMLIPDLVARALKLNPGDTVVLVVTNRDGSVNGKTFAVRGTLESATGPGGRDGYIHIADARELLRLEGSEVTEFAVRVRDIGRLEAVALALTAVLDEEDGRAPLEVHPWQKLSPFASIAGMIDALTLSIKIMLVAIVLVAIMNVMVMAVYERIREIGAIAAMGTAPSRILALFLAEGFLLGLAGTVAGAALSLAGVWLLGMLKLSFDFGQQQGLVLAPDLPVGDILAVCATVLAVAVLASFQPARKAARLDPITALRHV